jgi:hypothetical protein
MKKTGGIVSAMLALMCMNLYAQQKAKTPADKQPEKKVARKAFEPPVYLGLSDKWNGTLSKKDFTDLMKQGLTSKDSLGRQYKVISFLFTYAERNLYEDSVGNLVVKPDFSTTFCNGDTLPEILTRNIPASESKVNEATPGLYQRVKAGDTVYFDRISVVHYTPNTPLPPDSTAMLGRHMNFQITK